MAVRYSFVNRLVRFELHGSYTLDEIFQAFDRAESDRATVILTGREGVFSAGFDLKVMTRGGIDALSFFLFTAKQAGIRHPPVSIQKNK